MRTKFINMKKRFRMRDVEPEGYKLLMAMEAYLDSTDVEKTHRELIRLRASQLNGCTFCLDLHFRDACANGEDPARLMRLSAWKHSKAFNEKEEAILALTDAVTLIGQAGVNDAIYDDCISLLGERYTARVLLAIIAINGLNRLAITTGLLPGEKVATKTNFNHKM